MGEGTDRLKNAAAGAPARTEPSARTEPDQRPDPEDLERDIERLRARLASIADEVDRRRHEMLDWRLQGRRHARALAAGGAAIGVLAGGIAGLAIWKARHDRRPVVKLRRLEEAVARLAESPEDVARPSPSILYKALAAIVSTLAAALTKRLITWWISEDRRLPDASPTMSGAPPQPQAWHRAGQKLS